MSRLRPRDVLVAGLTVTLVLVLLGFIAPAIVLRGWLIGFVAVGGLGLGSVAWLAIHALTGGGWGEAGRPALIGASTALPLALLLAVPLLLADRVLYPWAVDPNTAGPGVASAYLNGSLVALRSVVLLGGVTLAAVLARRGPLGILIAAGTLVLYGVLMNLSAFDWLLSLDPRYTSSAFGMQIITAQLAAALCWVILWTEAPADDRIWGDYGGLLLATVLGEAYLILMTFVIHWYGDLPNQAAWYLQRSRHGWIVLEIGGLTLGAIGPLLALLFARVRHNPKALRPIAWAVLAGLVMETMWLVAPSLGHDGGWIMVAGLFAIGATGSLTCVMANRTALTIPTTYQSGSNNG